MAPYPCTTAVCGQPTTEKTTAAALPTCSGRLPSDAQHAENGDGDAPGEVRGAGNGPEKHALYIKGLLSLYRTAKGLGAHQGQVVPALTFCSHPGEFELEIRDFEISRFLLAGAPTEGEPRPDAKCEVALWAGQEVQLVRRARGRGWPRGSDSLLRPQKLSSDVMQCHVICAYIEVMAAR
jgi:hypothetical protein